jgi:hypothetical protein
MADNFTANPGAGGDTFAADDVSGVKYPYSKIDIGGDGVSSPVNASNPMPVSVGGSVAVTGTFFQATQPVSIGGPVAVTGALTDAELRASPVSVEAYGELIEAIEAMRFAVQALTRSIGQMLPDTAARMRVNVEAGTLPTVTTVGTVSTVTTMATLTNQTQIGGLAATEQIPALMRLGADSLRRNISVT